MAKIKSPFLNLVFKLLCLIGCDYQITKISLEYFSFKTTTKTTFQIDSTVDDPAIVYCTRYTDIIDRTNYQKYGIYKRSRYNSTEFLSDTTKLTISDIFHLTPNPNDTIISCEIRRNEYKTARYFQDYCYSIFRVTKYQEGPYICYQFQTKNALSSFKCDQAAFAYIGLNVLYRITIQSQFLLSNTLKLISFVPDNQINPILNLPTTSRRFYSYRLRYGDDEPKKSKHNYFLVSGDLYLITRLEKPYDTKCTRNKEHAEFACRRRCIITAFKKHGYFPATEYTLSPLPIKHMNTQAFFNKTLIRDTMTRSDICRKICNQKFCNEKFSVTDVSSTPELYNGLITIMSSCSNRPVVVIEYLPRITLMEFVMYISSSFGIWFGVSVLSINPFYSNKCEGANRRMQTRNYYSYRNEKRDFGETIRMAVQDFRRRVRQTERNEVY